MDTVRDIRTRFIGENRMGAAARSARRDVRTIGDEYDTLRRRISVTNQAIAGITLGIGGGSVARTLTDLQNQTARLGTLTNTLARDQNFLSDTSRRLSIDISAATAAFSRFNVLEQSGAINAGQSEEFLVGLGDAFARFGASAGQQENVIFGLAQALGQGTLQSQELNQVVEPLPGLLNDIARQAGLTSSEFRKLVGTGTVTSEMFRGLLLDALREYDGTAESLAGNIQQTLTRLSNSYKETLLTLQEPISGGVDQIATVITGALETVSANSGATVAALQTVGAAVAINYGARALRAVNDFSSAFSTSARQRIQLSNDEAEAYQRNGEESIAAQDRISAARANDIRLTRQQEAATARTARNSALIAANKARETVATRQNNQAKAQELLSTRNQTVAEREAGLEAANRAQQNARGAQVIAAANARVAASTDGAKDANRALAAANRELVTAENRVVTASNQLGAARNQQATASERLETATTRTNASLERQRITRDALNGAERRALSTTIQAGDAATEYGRRLDRANASGVRARAVIISTTVAMRAQQIAAGTLAAGMRGLSAAYAFVGGPVGAVLIAAGALATLVSSFAEQSEAIGTAEDELDRLRSVYRALGETAEQTEQRLTPVGQLTDRINELESRDLSIVVSSNAESVIDKITELTFANSLPFIANRFFNSRELEDARGLLEEITTEQERINSAQADVDSITRRANAIQQLAQQQGQLVDSATEFADRFNRADTNAEQLRERLATINRALSNQDINLSADRRAELQRALVAGQRELDNVTGVTAQRKEQETLLRNQLTAQTRIEQSLESELETAQRTFDENELQLRVNLERAENGAQGFNTQEIDALIVRNAQARETRITQIVSDEEKKRTDEADQERQRRQRAEDEAFNADIQRRRAVAEARVSLGDSIGSVNELLQIRTEEINRTTALENEARLLRRAAEIDSTREIERIKTEIVAEEARKRQEAFQVENVGRIAGVSRNFLSALISEIDGYIQITDEMSDAERTRAEESNRVNRREFERNKRFRQAQAIVDTFAGANKALAQGGIFGVASAAGIVAVGLRNVANISRQQYGSSSAGASAGISSVSSGGSNSQDGGTQSTGNGNAQQSNVFILSAPGETSQQTLDRYNNVLPELSRAAESNQVTISNDQLILSDATLLG